MVINPDKKRALLLEIHSQMLQLDIKIASEELVSECVNFLVQKRQLQELLNQIQYEL